MREPAEPQLHALAADSGKIDRFMTLAEKHLPAKYGEKPGALP